MVGGHVDDGGARRLREFDVALKAPLAATAFAVVPACLLATGRDGMAFTAWASLAAVYWAAGFAGLRSRVPMQLWYSGLLATTTLSVAATSVLSGGADSPVLTFAPLLGIGAVVLWPSWSPGRVLAPLVVSVVLGVDLLAGTRSPSPLAVSLFLISAATLPEIVSRVVDVELHHRRRSVLDPLTGCLNRHALDGRIAELDAQQRLVSDDIAVVVIDLDRFKHINDTHGHAAGDDVLASVAERLRGQLRSFELLYRTGGEEFVLLLPGATTSDAEQLAERLRAAVAAHDVGGIEVTASFGVAAADVRTDVTELIEVADRKMYEAKRAGRNTVAA